MRRRRFLRIGGLVFAVLLAVFTSLLITREIKDDTSVDDDVSLLPERSESIEPAMSLAEKTPLNPSPSIETVITEEKTTTPAGAATVNPSPAISGAETVIPTSTSSKMTPTTEAIVDASATQLASIEVTKRPQPIYAVRNISSTINGLTPVSFVVMPRDVVQHTADTFSEGQILGRRENHFSVVGDSIADPGAFLSGFDEGQYGLGDYAHLQPVIEYFSGSFARQGLAVRPGLNLTAVFDPLWADKEVCRSNETILGCEFRVHDPSVLLVLVGTNDAAITFEERMRPLLDYALEQGVIPVLVTKALPVGGAENPRNEITRRLAAEYKIPLLDFGLIAETLPNRGLDADAVHMTLFPEHDYGLSRALESGYGALNLSSLMVLDAIWQDVILAAE